MAGDCSADISKDSRVGVVDVRISGHCSADVTKDSRAGVVDVRISGHCSAVVTKDSRVGVVDVRMAGHCSTVVTKDSRVGVVDVRMAGHSSTVVTKVPVESDVCPCPVIHLELGPPEYVNRLVRIEPIDGTNGFHHLRLDNNIAVNIIIRKHTLG